ncbi:MAG TPA: TetM/TetW/TetO/TetS family tetracycline resistance ribosomal protection protein [Thermomicrobiales bacterium]|nr:TetM/TetW/TetO/TetS family tetracycline resistance ribosomal protection protein [Thermomicrobiales bacterium]
MANLNLGILAHVDAGKTTLTERILYETGVIAAPGSVDKGTTQTDSRELERARGITIWSAVASFRLGDLTVNLIDTPGHGDFIAEVARALNVLDAVVLVVSAVEGVQPQTRRLARAIRAAGLPLIIFVNKIDRLGARGEPLLDDIRQKLGLRVVALNTPIGLGDRAASVEPVDRDDPAWRDALTDLLAETSERVIEEYERTGGELSGEFLDAEMRRQVAEREIAPVLFGSAMTGVGVAALLEGVEAWLPPAAGDADASPSGSVFKIARRPGGEKIVYVRLFDGRLAVRQHVALQRQNGWGEPETIDERITAIDRFVGGAAVQTAEIVAGEIAALHGLREARIGDRIGAGCDAARDMPPAFPPPALESIVRPLDRSQITRLREALEQLAEQDPLISLRQRNEAGEISVRLYGEVQKEVLTDTLARDYSLGVWFGPSRTICVERLAGTGEALEVIFENDNPFYATLGFRVEPAAPGSGIRYERQLGSLPLAFYRATEETVYETLQQGLSGWEVIDCVVTLFQAGFNSVVSTAGDFRKLVPLVLMEAVRQAGTVVCEPIETLELESPEDTYGTVCGALIQARATIEETRVDGATCRLTCAIPTAELRGIEQQIPGLTRGEGGWSSHFAGYQPVPDPAPVRPRIGPNPLNRAHYLAEVARG